MVSSSTSAITKRSSKGRQKIEIKKIEAKERRQVTFSKRRAGLFKKAVELCVLTGAKVAILVKSPAGGMVYVLGEDLIDCYLNNTVVETDQLGFPKDEYNEWYADLSQELEVENRREMILYSSNNSEEESIVETGELGFPKTNEFNEYYAGLSRELEVENRTEMTPYSSEEESFDGMDIGQLEEYMCLMEEMKKEADTRADELKMNSNIPVKLGSEEMKKNVVVEENCSMMINNSQTVLESDEMKNNVVNEANDLMINNSQPMLDSDLSLDMNWSDSAAFDMSWLDSDAFDMSWINNYSEHGDTHTNGTFNLNFHHGVEV